MHLHFPFLLFSPARRFSVGTAFDFFLTDAGDGYLTVDLLVTNLNGNPDLALGLAGAPGGLVVIVEGPECDLSLVFAVNVKGEA